MPDVAKIFREKKEKEIEAEAMKWFYDNFYNEIKDAKVIESPKSPVNNDNNKNIGIKEGFIDGIRAIVNGVQRAIQSTLDFGTDINNFFTEPLTGKKYEYYNIPKINVGETQTFGGKIAEGIVQFLTPTMPISKISQSVGMSKKAVTYLSSIAGDLLAFEGNSGRLSDLLNEVPVLKHVVPDFLTTKEDDSPFVGRVKNVLEGLGVGALADTFIDTVLSAKKINNIKKSLPKSLEERINILKEEVEKIDIKTKEDMAQVDAIVDDLIGTDSWGAYKNSHLGEEIPSVKKGSSILPDEDISKMPNISIRNFDPAEGKAKLLDILESYKKTLKIPKAIDEVPPSLLEISNELLETKALLPAKDASEVLPDLLKINDDLLQTKALTSAKEEANIATIQEPNIIKAVIEDNNKKGFVSMDMLKTFLPETSGGVSGMFIDYNNDGKIDIEDIGIGVLGGAGVHALFILKDKITIRKDIDSEKIFNTLKETKIKEIDNLIKKLEEKKAGVTEEYLIKDIDNKIKDALELKEQVKNISKDKLATYYNSLVNKSIVAEQKKPIIKITNSEDKVSEFVNKTLSGETPNDVPFEFNAKYIKNVEDIEKVIKQTSEIFENEINKAKRGVQSFKNTSKNAEEYMLDNKVLNETFKNVKNLDAKVYAVRTILNSSARQLTEMAQLISSGKSTAGDLVDFKHLIGVHAGIQAQSAGIKTEIARALNAMKITASARLFSNEKNISDIVKTLGGKEDITKLAEIITRASSVGTEVMNSTVRDIVSKNLTNMAFEVFVSNILSNIKTPVVNIMSNIWSTSNYMVEEAISILFNKTIGDNTRTLSELAPTLRGLIEGAKDGAYLFIKAFKTGMPQFDQALNPLEFRHIYKAISSNSIRGLGETGYKLMENKGLANAVDLMGEILRFAQRPIIAGDDFFKAVNFRMALNQKAYQKAFNDALKAGFTGKELVEGTEELFRKYIGNPTEDLYKEAKDIAIDLTFSTPLSKKEGIIASIGEGLQHASAKSPLLKFIIPFIKTPTNLLEYTVERTPVLQYLSKSILSDLTAGGVRRETALAKLSMGSMYGLLVLNLIDNNMITSGLDRSKQSATENGRLQYSIKIGDKYYNYSRFDPIGAILAITSDIAFFVKNKNDLTEEDQKEVENLTTSFLRALANNITNKTYLKNLSDFLSALTDNSPQKWGKLSANIVRGFIPLSSLVGGVETAIAPEYKELFEWSDNIKERIPFVSDNLINKRSLVTGKVLKDEYPELTGVFLPTKIATESKDPLLNELDKVNLDFEKSRQKMRKIHGVLLTPEQYDLYVKTTGEKFYELAKEAIKTKAYQSLPTNLEARLNKQEYLSKIFKIAKMHGQGEVISKYNNDIMPKIKQRQELLSKLQIPAIEEE